MPDVLSFKQMEKRVCLCFFTVLHNICKTFSTFFSCVYLMWHGNCKTFCCSIQFCGKSKLYSPLTIFPNLNFLSKKTRITQCIFTKDRYEVLYQLINSCQFHTRIRNTENLLPPSYIFNTILKNPQSRKSLHFPLYMNCGIKRNDR